ncbi:MAG: hypothetical protein JWP87_1598 [Labilithrix sp.]|nr:hypothetical protein [Labilithrix sp.]
MTAPDAMKRSSTPSDEGEPEGVELEIAVEITEEEERVNDELIEHPTRDDLHEQRERGQKCEGVIHAHFTTHGR